MQFDSASEHKVQPAASSPDFYSITAQCTARLVLNMLLTTLSCSDTQLLIAGKVYAAVTADMLHLRPCRPMRASSCDTGALNFIGKTLLLSTVSLRHQMSLLQLCIQYMLQTYDPTFIRNF